MLDVDTSVISARMIDDHSFRDRPVDGVPCNSMGASIFPPEMELPVSVLIERVSPSMAVSGLLPFAIEPGLFWRGEIVHRSILTGPMGLAGSHGAI